MQNEIIEICDMIEKIAHRNTELSTGSSKIHAIAMLVDAELMKRMGKWNELEADKVIVGYVRNSVK